MAPKRPGIKVAFALAAAALVWSEAASAAVVPLPTPLDPLVALSALGTVGSQGAVCGAGASAAAASAASAAAAQGAAGGCVLPVSDVVPPPPPPGVAPPPPPGGGMSFIAPLLVGLVWVAAFLAIKSSGYATGSTTPISPA